MTDRVADRPGPGPADCIFCAIVAGQAPAEVIEETDRTVAFLALHPATPGHALVVPKAHAADIHDIGVDDLAAVAAAGQRIADLARRRLGCAGVNLVQNSGTAAWQSVFHFHLHVIPRNDASELQVPFIEREVSRAELARVGARLRGDAG